MIGSDSCVESPDGRYRYLLSRTWDETKEPLIIIGLHPYPQADPAVGCAVRWLMHNGYGGLIMLNMFAYKTDWAGVLEHTADPVGPLNDQYLAFATGAVAAWGDRGRLFGRERAVMQRIGGRFRCLGMVEKTMPFMGLGTLTQTAPLSIERVGVDAELEWWK